MTTVNHNMTSQRSRSQLVVLLHFGDGGTRSCHPYLADLRHRSSHHTHVPTNCGPRVEVGSKGSLTCGFSSCRPGSAYGFFRSTDRQERGCVTRREDVSPQPGTRSPRPPGPA